MAIYRKVQTNYWGDPFIAELTPEQKYFYIYLLTNEKTRQCGIYEISIKQIVFDTGYNNDTVKKLLEHFEKCGKIRYSDTTNEIALRNWPKYNNTVSDTVQLCVNKELKEVKNRDLIEYLYSTHTVSIPYTQEEEEQEQKEEQTPQDDLFEIFWNSYDKKIDKVKCLSKWSKLKLEERKKIITHVALYVLSTPDKSYRKNPETYLNKRSWENEIIQKQDIKIIQPLTTYTAPKQASK